MNRRAFFGTLAAVLAAPRLLAKVRPAAAPRNPWLVSSSDVSNAVVTFHRDRHGELRGFSLHDPGGTP